MSVSSYLRSERRACYNNIAHEEKNLRRLEALYSSLQRFSLNVDQTGNDFSTIGSRKKSVLSDLTPLDKNCKTVKRYHDGMTVVLDGIGVKVVSLALFNLKSMILAQQAIYKTQIEFCRANILANRVRIAELDVEIRAAEAAEEAARQAEREARRAAKAAKEKGEELIEKGGALLEKAIDYFD